MTAGNLHIDVLQAHRLVSLFAGWLHGCQIVKVLCYYAGTQVASQGRSLEQKQTSALKDSGSSCQNSTTGSSSFHRRVEPLNHVIVLIFKHYYKA